MPKLSREVVDSHGSIGGELADRLLRYVTAATTPLRRPPPSQGATGCRLWSLSRVASSSVTRQCLQAVSSQQGTIRQPAAHAVYAPVCLPSRHVVARHFISLLKAKRVKPEPLRVCQRVSPHATP